MADVEQEVETRFTVADKATKHLGIMQRATERFSKSLNSASQTMGNIAGIAGFAGLALGMKEVVQGSLEYVGSMYRISQLTGDTVQKTVGLAETMAKFGVTGDDAERLLLRMSKKGAALEANMMAATGRVGGMASEFQRMGVNMKNGPEAALVSISKKVSQGKMGVGEVARLLGVFPRQALQVMELLKQGPDAIKKSIDDAAKKSPISMSTVDQYRRIKILGNEIGVAWEQIRVKVGVKLMPLIEKMMEYVRTNLDVWVDKATEFGQTLGHFLDQHGKQIMMIGKLLLANYAVMKLTGKGAVQLGMKGFGGAMAMGKSIAGGGAMTALGSIGPKIGAIGAALSAAAIPLAIAAAVIAAIASVLVPGVIALRVNFEGMTTKVMGVVAKIKAYWDVLGSSSGAQGLMQRLSKFFSRESAFGRFFMRLLPSGILVAARVFEGILHTVFTMALFFERIGEMGAYLFGELTGFLGGVWDSIVGIFTDAIKYVKGIFTSTADGVGGFAQSVLDFFKPIYQRVTGIFSMISDAIGSVLSAVLAKLAPIAKVFNIVFDTAKDLVSTPVQMWKQAWDDIEKATNAQMHKSERAERVMARPTPGNRPGINQNFYNARFDITQKFAEGFDPDRIAVAFTNDLAALGERKLQSGFSPLFAIR